MSRSSREQITGASLREWALDPERGGALIAWGTPDDTARCRLLLDGKIPTAHLDQWCAELGQAGRALAAIRAQTLAEAA